MSSTIGINRQADGEGTMRLVDAEGSADVEGLAGVEMPISAHAEIIILADAEMSVLVIC